MNKQRHRIVFNKRRGQYMAVAETTCADGKATGTGPASRRLVRKALAPMVGAPLALVAVFMASAQAQIVADPRAAATQRPTVLAAPNGVPVVNVQTPSAAGVSRNVYGQFDVGAQGAILNNSRSNVQSQLGGWVQGNPWLATGSARVIVNEVNSSNPSQLKGYIEIAGQRAELVIANPAGIQVDGAGFINASRAVLSTGTPQFGADGTLGRHRVERGVVSVGGRGLDASLVDYTGILARAVELNARIWAKELTVVAGQNTVGAAIGQGGTDAATPLVNAAAGERPRFALDVSQLGGMYAGKIHLIGTEAGVGMRNAGAIGASAGQIVITAQGQLLNSGAIAGDANADVSIRTTATTNAGRLQAAGSLSLQGGDLTNTGTVSAVGQLTLESAGRVDNAGTLSGARLQIDAQLLQNTGAVRQTGAQSLAVSAAQVRNVDSARIETPTAPALGVAGGSPSSPPAASAGGSSPSVAGSTTAPPVPAGTAAAEANWAEGQIRIAGALDNRGPAAGIDANGSIKLATRSLDNSAGRMAIGTLTVGGGSVSNLDGSIVVQGPLELQASTLDNRRGSIEQRDPRSAAARIDVGAGTLDNSAGRIAAEAPALSIAAGALVNDRGSISATAGAATLTLGTLDNRGSIFAGTDLATSAAQVTNTGSMTAGANQRLATTAEVNNAGTIAASGSLQLQAQRYDGRAGSTLAAGVSANGSPAARGDLQARTTGAFSSAGTQLSSGTTELAGATVDLSGSSNYGSNIALNATSDIRTRRAVVAAGDGGVLSIAAGPGASTTLDNTEGRLSAGRIDIAVGRAIDNSHGAILQSGSGDLTLAVAAADGLIDNSAGRIANNGSNLTISAPTLRNEGGAIEHAGAGRLTITAAGTLQGSRGSIITNGSLGVQAGAFDHRGAAASAQQIELSVGGLDNQGGHISQSGSTRAQVEVAGALNNTGGAIGSNGALVVRAGPLLNLDGTITARHDASIRSGDLAIAAGGEIRSAEGAVRITAEGVRNEGGTVAAATHLDIQAASLDNRGTLYAAGSQALLARDGVTNTGLIGAQSDLSVRAASFTGAAGSALAGGLAADGSRTRSGDVSVVADDLLQSAGTQSAAGTLRLQGASIDLTGARASGRDVAVTATAGDVTTRNASVGAAAEGTLALQANASPSARLVNAGGTLSAGRLQIDASNIDNAGGALLHAGSTDLAIRTAPAGMLDNSGGRIAANAGSLRLEAAQLRNAGGSIDHAGSGALMLAASESFAGAGGRIRSNGRVDLQAGALDHQGASLAAGDIAVSAASLDNRGGSIIAASRADLRLRGAFNNAAGTVSAGQALELRSGDVDNSAGTLQSTGSSLTLTAGSLLNAGGLVYAASDLKATLTSLANSGTLHAGAAQRLDIAQALDNSGTINAFGGSLDITAARLSNHGGSLMAGHDLTVALGSGDLLNQRGSLGAVQGVRLQAGAIDNRDTLDSAGALGIQGASVDLRATRLDNTQGRLNGSAAIAIELGDDLVNTAGRIASASGATVRAGAVTNLGGTIEANGSLDLAAVSLSGAGRLRANRDLTLALQSSYLHEAGASLSAGGQLSFSTAGDFINQGVLRNDGGLSIHALNIDNRAGAALSSAATTSLIAGQLITNRGLIDGAATRIEAGTELRNLGGGRIYGDTVALAAPSIVNAAEDGTAPVIAARQRLDIGAQQVRNAEHAQLLSLGDMAIAGALGTDGRADTSHLAASVDNNSASIDATGHLDIAAQAINNTNEHLAYELRAGSTQRVQQFAPSNSTTRYDASDVKISSGTSRSSSLHQWLQRSLGWFIEVFGNGEDWRTILHAERNVLVDGYFIQMLLPSTRFGFEAYARYYSPAGTLMPRSTAWQTADSADVTFRNFGAHYGANDTIWRDFGVTPPPATPAPAFASDNPCRIVIGCTVGQLGYPTWETSSDNSFLVTRYFSRPVTQADVDQAAAYDAWTAARRSSDQALDAALDAFYADMNSRKVGDFTVYEFDRSTQQAVLTRSDPGRISAGGDIRLRTGASGLMRNQSSRIVAGGALIQDGGSLRNESLEVSVQSTDVGQATTTYNSGSGVPNRGFRHTAYSATSQQTVIVAPGQVEVQGDAPAAASIDVRQLADNAAAGAQNVQLQAARLDRAAASSDAATSARAPHHGGTSAGAPGTAVAHAPETARAVRPSSGAADAATAQGASAIAASAVLQAGRDGAIVRTLATPMALPDSALYRVDASRPGGAIVETDPRFTQYRQWLSSDYLLQALRIDPAATQKRLGDGFYEQQLVREQVQQLSGRRFLGDYRSDDAQYRALLGAGATFAAAHQLRPGIALSAEQMAQLSSDIVWLVERDIALPDGRSVRALVPQVYVKVRDGDLAPSGALISGDSVQLALDGDAANLGTVAGRRVVRIEAKNVEHLGGRIAADAVAIDARQDIDVSGASIDARRLLDLQAGRDIRLSTTTAEARSTAGASSFERRSIDRVAGLYVAAPGGAGALSIAAGRDLLTAGAAIVNAASDSATVLQAGNDVRLGSVTTRSAERLEFDADHHRREATTREVGTTIRASGDLTLAAGRDVQARAAQISAGATALVAAGRDIRLEAGESRAQLDEYHHARSGDGFSSTQVTHAEKLDNTRAQATTLEGGRVAVQARRDISVVASHVVSDLGTGLQAGRDLTIQSQAEQTRENHFEEFKASGFGAGGFLWGKTKQSLEQDRQAQSAAGSTVASLLGDVQLESGNAYRQSGSLVQTPGGDIGIRAGEVRIDTAREHEVSRTVQRYEASGISLSLGGAVGSAFTAIQQQAQAAEQTSSGRMQALAGLNSAASVYNAAQSLQAADAAKAQALLDGKPEPANTAIGLRIGFSSSKSQSTSIEERHSGAGSAVQAGGKVAIEATQGDLTIQGSRLEAGGDLSLKAAKDLKLEAEQNTRRLTNDSSSRSSGFGVTIFANGIGVDASASRSQANSRTDERTQVATVVKAGGTATLASGSDTNLVGAQVRADRIEAQVGSDLTIHSLQDTSSTRGNSSSSGVGVGFGVGGPSLNISIGQGQVKADYASVQQQAGLFAGNGGFEVQVEGKTELVGAAIVSAQGANNQLSTGTLVASDLANRADYSASSVGISLGTGAAGLSGSGGFGQDSGHAASTTRSAIGQGTVTTDAQGQQAIASVRRDQTSEQDGAQRITPIFDQRKVQAEVAAQVAITQAFGQQASRLVGDYAQTRLQEAGDLSARAAAEPDPTRRAELQAQARQLESDWGDQGRLRLAAHTAIGGLTGGAAGALGALGGTLSAPLVAEALDKAKLDPRLTKALTGLASTALGAAVGGPAGGVAAGNEVANNFLTHAESSQRFKLQMDIQSCKDDACRSNKQAEIDRLNRVDAWRDQQIDQACASPASIACQGWTAAIQLAARSYDGKSGALLDTAERSSVQNQAFKYRQRVNDPFAYGIGQGLLNLTPVGVAAGTLALVASAVQTVAERGPAQALLDGAKAIAGLPRELNERLGSSDPTVRGQALVEVVALATGAAALTAKGAQVALSAAQRAELGAVLAKAQSPSGNPVLKTGAGAARFNVVEQAATGIKWGQGIEQQGMPFENYVASTLPAEARLPPKFKVFDFFDVETGVATSVKTMDTSTPSRIANPAQIYSSLKRDVDATAGFDRPYTLNGTTLNPEHISARELRVAIPSSTTSSQWESINSLIQYGKSQGVVVLITVVRP